MKTGIIYMATSPSGKSYIGQTVQDLRIRIKKHYVDSKRRSCAFANALNKYNKPEKWKWDIIYSDIPMNQLCNMERWCIANHNTYYKGYNSTFGGEDNPMNHPHNRKKVSEANKGRKFSLEHKIKLSIVNTGEGNPQSKLTWNEVNKIRTEYTTGKYTHRKLAREYNVGKTIIGNILTNKSWIK